MTPPRPEAHATDRQTRSLLVAIERQYGAAAYHTIDLYPLFSAARIPTGAWAGVLLALENAGYVINQGDGVLGLTTAGIRAATASIT